MEHNEIRKLAELMKEMDLTVLNFTEGNLSVHLERGVPGAAAAPAAGLPPEASAPVPAGKPSGADADLYTVASPMIGVFYASPAPDAKAYVSVGDTVRAGDVLCVIEAMKIMNEITADVSGVVTEICVADRQVVEYGHPLFRIRTAESGPAETEPAP